MALQFLGIEVPEQAFTPQSIYTISFMAAGTFAVCNSLQRAINFNPRWFGLIFAQLLVFTLHDALAPGAHSGLAGILVSFVNGCIVYLTAGGATGILAALAGARDAAADAVPDARPASTEPRHARRFASRWF